MNDVLILLQDTVEEMQILVECYNCPQVRETEMQMPQAWGLQLGKTFVEGLKSRD